MRKKVTFLNIKSFWEFTGMRNGHNFEILREKNILRKSQKKKPSDIKLQLWEIVI